ncbi:MAG TPA: MlaD family protein [Gammaproteobacteria bacterium]|nr:MlaD family protein [Gammaproteobacteria bacterium]HET7587768.1 MlaD family protein [Gammaproteobacteria bacterium]
MENKSHAIIAVTFLIVFSFAAILVYYWLAHQQPEPRFYKIVTSQGVGGIQAKSPVTFKGLLVGHVQKVGFNKQDPAKVDILFTVSEDTLVTQSTYAVMQIQGITGGKSLALKLGKGSRKPLKTSEDNPALIPLHLGLLAKLQSVGRKDLKKINDIISSVQALVNDENQKHLTQTIQQIDEATRKIVVIENHLMPVVKMLPKLAESAQQTLDQSHALLAQATDLAQAAKKPIKKAGAAADALAEMTTTGEQIAAKLQRQTLPDIDQLSESLLRTSESLQELSKQLQTNPQSLIFGAPKPQPGPGEPGFGSGENGG